MMMTIDIMIHWVSYSENISEFFQIPLNVQILSMSIFKQAGQFFHQYPTHSSKYKGIINSAPKERIFPHEKKYFIFRIVHVILIRPHPFKGFVIDMFELNICKK